MYTITTGPLARLQCLLKNWVKKKIYIIYKPNTPIVSRILKRIYFDFISFVGRNLQTMVFETKPIIPSTTYFIIRVFEYNIPIPSI